MDLMIACRRREAVTYNACKVRKKRVNEDVKLIGP